MATLPGSALAVRLAAIVASAARPIAAPTVRDVLSRPEASPASRGGTPAVPATAIGVTARPMPIPIRTKGPSRPPRKVDVVVAWASHARPAAGSQGPGQDQGTGAELRHQASGDLRAGRDQQRLGQEGEARLQRAVAEHVLHVERLEVPGPEERAEHHEHDDVAARDRARTKDPERHQRRLGEPGLQHHEDDQEHTPNAKGSRTSLDPHE